MLFDPSSLVMAGIIYACAQHMLGNTCDEDAACWQWTRMYGCHERYFGEIRTPAYRRALADGHNPKPRTP